MALQITNVENAPYQDGLRLKVTLSGAPTGTLTFYGHPRPGFTAAGPTLKPHTALGGNQYAVTVRSGAPAEPGIPARMPFWLEAQDDDGPSNRMGEFLAAGLNTGWRGQVDDALGDVLRSNIGLLDLVMQRKLAALNWPSGRAIEVGQIHRGEPKTGNDAKFPGVCYQTHTLTEDYQGLGNMEAGRPYSDLVPFTATIQCYSAWQSDRDWAFVLKELGDGVFNVLNQPVYYRLNLPSGLSLFECRCTSGHLEEYFDAAMNTWMVTDQLTWVGQLHAGKYDPNIYPAS